MNELDLDSYNNKECEVNIDESNDTTSDSNSSGDDSEKSVTDTQKAMNKKKAIIRQAVSKNISRFYLLSSIDITDNEKKDRVDKELEDEFGSDLEVFSDDEIKSDVEDMLKEDNKKQGRIHAKSINEQMEKMSESFCHMRHSNEKNLNQIQDFIK